jgi:hypothetical protein
VKALEDRPERRADLELYWVAFFDLTTCRPPGFEGALPIPWDAIDQWAQRHSIIGESFDGLVHMVRAMDAVFLEWAQKPDR